MRARLEGMGLTIVSRSPSAIRFVKNRVVILTSPIGLDAIACHESPMSNPFHDAAGRMQQA